MNISNTCASYNSNSSVAINSKELAEIYTEDFEQMFIKINIIMKNKIMSVQNI